MSNKFRLPNIRLFSVLRRLMNYRHWNPQRGFTLVEAVVAMTVFSVGIIGVIQVTSTAKSSSEQGRDTVQASNYLQEGMEAVRAVRDTNWASVSADGSYRLVSNPGASPAWTLASGGTETVGKYNRTVQIAGVSREDTDSSGTLTAGDKIVPSGGTLADPDTKRVTVTMSWKQGPRTVTRSVYAYLTNWQG